MQGLTEAFPRNDSPGENQANCKCDTSEDHHRVHTSYFFFFVSMHLMLMEEKKTKISHKRFSHVMQAQDFLILQEIGSQMNFTQLSLHMQIFGI